MTWLISFFESDSAPAWIQAVGSVFAIGVAIAIAWHQSRVSVKSASKKLAASEVHKFLIIKALMVRAHGLSDDICRAIKSAKFEDFDKVSPELMLDTHNAFLSLPLFEIPHGLLALDVLMVGRYLGVIREKWIELVLRKNKHEPLVEEIAQLDGIAKEVREISFSAMEMCAKEILKRGYNKDGSP